MMYSPLIRHPSYFVSNEKQRIEYQAKKNKRNLAIYKRKRLNYELRCNSDNCITSTG